MRKAINENPVAQAVLIGVLLLAAGFLVATRLLGGETVAQQQTPVAQQPGTSEAPAPAPGVDPAAPGVDPVAPAVPDPAPGGTAVPAMPLGEVGEFTPGPGLPRRVVRAHRSGDTVVLFVFNPSARVDRRTRRISSTLDSMRNVSLIEVRAGQVARYSRVMRGVDLDRLPAVVVISPPERGGRGGEREAALPMASVAYGFRSPASAVQAVRDARYSGPRDLPYDPR